MASLDKYNSISKQLSDLVSNYSKERDQKVADTKTQYGYDDRISNLENLKKTSLDTERVIRALPTDVNNRLVGRRMTGSQRNRVFAKEQAPLAQQLADVSMGVQTEQQGIDLVRNLINDVLGQSREDFNNRYNVLNTDLGTAWNEYSLSSNLEEQQRQRAFQSQQNALTRAIDNSRLQLERERIDYDKSAKAKEEKRLQDQAQRNLQINKLVNRLSGKPNNQEGLAIYSALQELGYDTRNIKLENGKFSIR